MENPISTDDILREKRRKRILESSHKRMNFLKGTTETPNLTEGEKPAKVIEETNLGKFFFFIHEIKQLSSLNRNKIQIFHQQNKRK
jgi:hypothetical protein